jgi:hypothetical protein
MSHCPGGEENVPVTSCQLTGVRGTGEAAAARRSGLDSG